MLVRVRTYLLAGPHLTLFSLLFIPCTHRRCCERACEDAEPGCGGASPRSCRDRCEYRRCRDVCDSSDGDDDDDDDSSTTFLSSDQTHKCSNKNSEDSCE